MHPLRDFQTALAFLSRLVPIPAKAALDRALPYFVPAGLVLGCLAAGVAAGAAQLWAGTGTLVSLVAAWLWLVVMALATRAMHWDALADIADAAGSLTRGARFWEIMKDSRVGAFAVLAIVAVWLGQWVCVAAHVERGQWLWLAFAPAWARGACLCLSGQAPAAASSTLGQSVCAGVGLRHSGLNVAQWHLLSGLGLVLAWVLFARLCLWQAVALLAIQALVHCWFARLARQQGGLSGDFLGADIELAQLCFLLCTL